jgi:glycosyltransferase involved in cell wall biosynthesis
VSDRLRVLHLCAGNLYGGVERIVLQCALSRDSAPGMDPAFAVCFEGRLARELELAGVAPLRLGAVRARAPWTVLRARRALGRALASHKPDVVLCHSSWIFALAGPVAAAHSVPQALWLHDRVSGRTWVERWARATTPSILICNSMFTAESARTMYPDVPASVLYAPVAAPALPAPSDRARLRRELDAPDDVPAVIVAARFERWKGHRELLAALAGIPRPWRLWIAGGAQKPSDVEEAREIRAQSDALGISSRVTFLGERNDVPALMAAADVHCQPNSGPEPFGLAFVEALYAGLPVVTTDMGGAREIVTPDCGVLVPSGDAGALRAALAAILIDAAARARLGAAGPARAAALCDPGRQLRQLAGILAGTRAEVHA